MAACPIFYANCPDIIVNSISFHSLRCSSLDHKLYGHLEESARSERSQVFIFPTHLISWKCDWDPGRACQCLLFWMECPSTAVPGPSSGGGGGVSHPYILCAWSLMTSLPPSRTLLATGLCCVMLSHSVMSDSLRPH